MHRKEAKKIRRFPASILHSVWKSEKKSHSVLRAKRATFTFWVDKSSLKCQKWWIWRVFENMKLPFNSVTRRVNCKRTKVGGKFKWWNETFWVSFKHCDLLFPSYWVNQVQHQNRPKIASKIHVYCVPLLMFHRGPWRNSGSWHGHEWLTGFPVPNIEASNWTCHCPRGLNSACTCICQIWRMSSNLLAWICRRPVRLRLLQYWPRHSRIFPITLGSVRPMSSFHLLLFCSCSFFRLVRFNLAFLWYRFQVTVKASFVVYMQLSII